jgi:hypothetical protein
MPSIHTTLTPSQLAHDLAVRDLTDPTEGGHAIQLLIGAAVARLAAAWGCQVRRHRGPRVVPVADNYDRLHTPAPHQLDLWRVSRRPLGHHDLEQMAGLLVEALTPGRPWRSESRRHPYTLDGRQVDVCWAGEWVEVWECGLAHPAVLEAAGLAGWSGLALGMGLDRLLMLPKGIRDIRLLRSADPRVAGQPADLAPWRPVSAMPPVCRDLSVAVAADDTFEDLGDPSATPWARTPTPSRRSRSWPRRPPTGSRPAPWPASASTPTRRTSWSGSSCATWSGP